MNVGVRRATSVPLLVPSFRPHGEIRQVNPNTGSAIGAVDFHRTSFGPICLGACPIDELDVVQLNTIPSYRAHGRPVLIDVQTVRIAVTDEIFKHDVGDRPVSSIGFDHVHLVRRPGVHVLVGDIRDVGVRP